VRQYLDETVVPVLRQGQGLTLVPISAQLELLYPPPLSLS